MTNKVKAYLIVPLLNCHVSIQSNSRPVCVAQYDPDIKDMRELPFHWQDGRVNLIVPKISGHEMIVLYGVDTGI